MANAMPFDLNGDQRTDILTTTVSMNNAPQNVALLQTSNGTYTPQTFASPSSDAGWVVQGYGDFDGDRIADDLFWWNLASGQTALVTFSNSGLSSTVNLTAVQSFDYLPEFADFNGDGRTDVAWQNAQGDTAEVWLMDGNGIASKMTSPLDIANLMPSLESLTVHPFNLPELPEGFLIDGLGSLPFEVNYDYQDSSLYASADHSQEPKPPKPPKPLKEYEKLLKETEKTTTEGVIPLADKILDLWEQANKALQGETGETGKKPKKYK